MVNIVFGLVIFFILNCFTGTHVTTRVNDFVPDIYTQAQRIQKGDQIYSINNKRVRNSGDVRKQITKSEGKEIKVTMIRNGEKIEQNIIPTQIDSTSAGIYLSSDSEKNTTKILTVMKDSASYKAGIRANDVITKMNGENVENNSERVVEIIQNSVDKEIHITLRRNQNIMESTLKPDIVSQYLLGVEFEMASGSFIDRVYYSYFNTVEFSFSIIDSLKQLVSGGVSMDQMMGPVGISQVVAKTSGFSDFINILALVSLSLGVTNLLPIIPLDGGKIVLLIVEAIRKKPFKQETELKLQTIGFMLLIGLSVVVLYYDVLRIF